MKHWPITPLSVNKQIIDPYLPNSVVHRLAPVALDADELDKGNHLDAMFNPRSHDDVIGGPPYWNAITNRVLEAYYDQNLGVHP
eukprot:4288063-Pyramimonas_sp.AAC.1